MKHSLLLCSILILGFQLSFAAAGGYKDPQTPVEQRIDDLISKMTLEEKIDMLGGVIPAIEEGFFQREIAEAAYRYQSEIDRKEKIIVGVNEYVEDEEQIEIPILIITPEVEAKQKRRLAELRHERNANDVEQTISELQQGAADGSNLMPLLLKATRAYVTLGEMCNALAEHFGVYEEPAVF